MKTIDQATPGEWILTTTGNYVVGDDTEPVCYVSAHRGSHPEMQTANAALLAASKDVTLALIQCLQLIDDMFPGVQFIALRDYALLNDAPIAGLAALRKAGAI